MKRLISLLLAAVMALSMAACNAAQNTETTPPETKPVETAPPETLPVFEEVENPVTFFSVSLGENFDNIRSMTVSDNGDGTVHVEFVSDVKKVCDLDANIFHGIAAALADAGLADLNGQENWVEGEANGSMYIEMADGSCITAGFNGEIPEAYSAGYDTMEAFFEKLTAAIDVYVPQPVVQGEVDEVLLAEMTAILNAAALANPDSYVIGEVARDEFFTFTTGLSSDEGIASAVTCSPMMMTTAYSLALVSLEEGADIEAVCDDFRTNLDWNKWVCAVPSNALIATKDNMALCLMADGELFALTSIGVSESGWTVVDATNNPN